MVSEHFGTKETNSASYVYFLLICMALSSENWLMSLILL